ncbi:VanZ family protein [Cytobacillus oceanisediminis]|uniref:VanZ family protein n=1 Tax=Cytobacillus oceanisediminis TaxID=665099 RepID=UPI001D140ADC|nr:VanZ family protein [Cytobacillus oceanisediminis]MCC3648525.1 VanZ family protein [Cytobacillus oceanisediminis]
MFRCVFLLFWCTVIFISTCSASLETFLESGIINFNWTGNPSYSDFFNPMPVSPSLVFLLRKLGHAFVFFILTVVLFSMKGNLLYSGLSAFFFAVSTEILQLFFARDGRLFDVAFDSLGIVLALILLAVIYMSKTRAEMVPLDE